MLGLPRRWAMRPFVALVSSFKTVILTMLSVILNEMAFKECGMACHESSFLI